MKRITLFLLTALLVLVLAACAADNKPTMGGDADSAHNETNASAASPEPLFEEELPEAPRTVYPLTEQDATGQSITFEKAPDKIVSTSPSETEMLFALGLADRIVGVSDFDNYPEEAVNKPKVGGVVEPNAEAIVAAGADLVISGISIKEAALEHLRSLGLTVISTNPKTVEDVLNNILMIGRITDAQPEAEALVAQMKADIQKVQDAAAAVKPEDRKKIYIEFSPGWTVGSGEFMNELIMLAGGINIAADVQGWSKIDEEKIIQDNPDVILYTLNTKNDSDKTIDELIYSRNGWSEIQAVKNKQVVGMEGNVLSRPGPRITQALLEISNALYPGAVE